MYLSDCFIYFLKVTALPEFFSQDDVFIAFGTEKPVADDFLLDSEGYFFFFLVVFQIA